MRKSEDAAPAPATAQSQVTDGKLEELSKLGQLRENGVLTLEEFDREKARILAKEK